MLNVNINTCVFASTSENGAICISNPTPPFLEKLFHPHPYCQIRGSQYLLPLHNGGGIRTMITSQ